MVSCLAFNLIERKYMYTCVRVRFCVRVCVCVFVCARLHLHLLPLLNSHRPTRFTPLPFLSPLSLCVHVRRMLDSYLLSPCSSLHSDYIIEEKNAVLQKKENEGFGFVLRGAKGERCTYRYTPVPFTRFSRCASVLV